MVQPEQRRVCKLEERQIQRSLRASDEKVWLATMGGSAGVSPVLVSRRVFRRSRSTADDLLALAGSWCDMFVP